MDILSPLSALHTFCVQTEIRQHRVDGWHIHESPTQASGSVARGLVEARQEAGLTQCDLADGSTCPYTTVARVEQGQRRLDVLEFMLWAKALDAPAGTLFKRVERRVGSACLAPRENLIQTLPHKAWK